MCEFAQLKDSLIRDRIVCGIICDKIRARLLKESELTLQTAWNICRANEAISSQLKSLSTSATSKETQQDVFAVHKQHPSEKPKQRPKCDKCGNQHYH